MRSNEPGNLDGFVETATYQHLRESLENGQTPILLLGRPGSGKTTLLYAIANGWQASGRPVVLISLGRIGREQDLYRIIQHELAFYIDQTDHKPGDIIFSSGRATLRATLEVLESVPTDLLLLLDGLDETADPDPVLKLLDQASRSSFPKIVTASRIAFNRNSRTFRSVIDVQTLSVAETRELIFSNTGAPIDTKEFDFISRNFDGSPLALKLILDFIRDNGIPSDLTGSNRIDLIIARVVDRELSKLTAEHRDSYVRALVSLAILNRPVPRSEYPARTLLELNFGGPLTTVTDEVMIVHPAVAKALMSMATLTSESADSNLSSLDFGAEEAERDSLLADGFIALPEFLDVVKGRKNIVIGDRGAGKSAMFSRILTASNADSVSNQSVVKSLTHPAELLRRLEANGSQLTTADQFRAGWLTLVAFCLADQVKTFSSPDHTRAATYLMDMLGDEPRTNRLVKGIKALLQRIARSSVKIKLGPVMIEPAGKAGAATTGGSLIDLRAFIEDAAKSLAKSGRIALIPLDRIDEIHKYDRELQQKAVQGLFLAEGDLAQLATVRLVIFLRSDLFKIYDIQEKNKLISRSMSISWSKSQLLAFLIERVLSNQCLRRIKDLIRGVPDEASDIALAAILPSEIEGMSASEWLWEWMENGNGDVSPRQIILLLILATQSPAAQRVKMSRLPIFPLDALQWGMDRLSELSFKELVDDFRVAPTFLANCRAGRLDSFVLGQVEPLFSEDEGSISIQIERLERLGFLERVVVQAPDGSKSSHFEVPKLFTRGWSVS